MILLWWGSKKAPTSAKAGGGGPPPPKRRRFVYDVYQSGRTVRRPASQDVISASPPKLATRVVVENQPSEAKARKAAKAVAKAQLEQAARVAFRPAPTAHAAAIVREIDEMLFPPQRVAELAAVDEATEEHVIISILLELGELDG